MSKKKALALLLSLALVITSAMPGTWAVPTDGRDSAQATVAGLDGTDPTLADEGSEDPGHVGPACTCGTLDDIHGEDCPLYEAPLCECGSLNGIHADYCPLYGGPGCTCGTLDGIHGDGCPLYAAPEEPENPDTFPHIGSCSDSCDWGDCPYPCHIPSLFDLLMACTSLEEFEQILAEATENQLAALTEEEWLEIDAMLAGLAKLANEPVQVVSFTDAAPLVDAGCIPSPLRRAAAPFAENSLLSTEGNGLILDKNAELTGTTDNPTVTITLEAYTTGTVTTETSVQPCDIVVIVDQSQKLMQAGMNDGKKVGEVLKAALQAFVDGLDPAHRIAFATFGSGGSGSSSPWYDLTTSAGHDGADTYIMSSIDTGGKGAQANHIDGLSRAEILLQNSTNNKVVILISAGHPTSTGNQNAPFDLTVADGALEIAAGIKESGATVYSVGIFDDADGSSLPSSDSNPENQYMHYISSNFPNAQSMNAPGTGSIPADGSYFLSAGNTADLTDAFASITTQVGTPSISLDKDTTQIVDTTTPQFTMPANASRVSFYTQAYDGTSFSGIPEAATGVFAAVENDTLTVTGYNFDENYISSSPRGDNNYYGQKLIIKFTITADPDFLGGDDVPTNTTPSGVYSNGELVGSFTSPTVDYPVQSIAVGATDQSIYLSNAFNPDEMIGIIDKRLNGENNAYVDVTYEIYDGSILLATYTVPAGSTRSEVQKELAPGADFVPDADKSYTVVCKVSGNTQKQVAEDSATVHVFVPSVSAHHTTIYRGDSISLADCLDAVTWSCGCEGVDAPPRDSTVPIIDYHFTAETDPSAALSPVISPPTCTYVTAAVDIVNDVGNRSPATADFTVHVLQPSFELPTFDVWADYSDNVNLKTYGTDSPYAAWSTCGHNNAPAAAGSAPSISKYTLTFANGSTLIANDLYTAGEQDVTFTPTLTSVKLSNGAALAGTDLSVTKQDAFTVHINRFDLIITKAWTGPSTYKQDAIFTVGRDDTRESFQLVIPKNESSITVTGLFCGHSYTVTEEGNWSWRYRASGDGDVSCDGHDISRTPPAAHSVGTSFTNTLSNNRWLNGSAYCPNKFTTVLNAAQSAVSGLLNLFRKKEG